MIKHDLSTSLAVMSLSITADTILEGDASDGKFLLRKRPGFPLDFVLTVVYELYCIVNLGAICSVFDPIVFKTKYYNYILYVD